MFNPGYVEIFHNGRPIVQRCVFAGGQPAALGRGLGNLLSALATPVSTRAATALCEFMNSTLDAAMAPVSTRGMYWTYQCDLDANCVHVCGMVTLSTADFCRWVRLFE